MLFVELFLLEYGKAFIIMKKKKEVKKLVIMLHLCIGHSLYIRHLKSFEVAFVKQGETIGYA